MRGVLRSRRFWAALLGVAVALSSVTLLGGSSTVSAHPLGNFTINQYSRIELDPESVRVRYVLDMAEIPAFQERGDLDTDGDGATSAIEKSAYLSRQVERLGDGIVFELNGAPVALRPVASDLLFPPGQGGLDTLRIEIDFAAPLPEGWEENVQQAQFRDGNYGERIGWREVVVRSGDGVSVFESTAPAQDISDELRAYPANGLNNPLGIDSVTFSFRPGGSTTASGATAATTDEARATGGNPDSSLAAYADLIAKDRITIGVAFIALLAAVGFGALHALSPGHGKTIVAAYLIGSNGTWRHALLLALTVTATHTSSVYALGFVTLWLSEYILPEDLYPWLSVGSGGLIVAMGLTLLAGRLRSSGLLVDLRRWAKTFVAGRPATRFVLAGAEAGVAVHDHDEGPVLHSHAGHAHDLTAHGHGFGSAHNHVVPGQDGRPVTWRSLVGLGVFGGLLPCPSAVVVMLSAIALHRVAFGLLLIVAFSFGLAAVLTAIGFALVYAGPLARRLPFAARAGARLSQSTGSSLVLRAFPAASASVVLAAGLVVLLRGLSQRGLL